MYIDSRSSAQKKVAIILLADNGHIVKYGALRYTTARNEPRERIGTQPRTSASFGAGDCGRNCGVRKVVIEQSKSS
jgi:hypothetical protein